MFKHFIRSLYVALLCFAAPISAVEPDWSAYQAVLKHVKPGTKNGVALALVDYSAIRADSLAAAYRTISEFDPSRLSGRDEQLAFYINAYNILAMKTVSDNRPLHSIKDLGNWLQPVWNKPAGVLNGKTVSLDEVEHRVLRPMGEPRIHLAIVCASVSCPDLRDEPYTAAKLSAQLDDQARRFLDNPGKGLLIEKDRIRVSKIFDWFEEDFAAGGGVEAFIRQYKPDLPKLKIKADIDYDWSLNGNL